MEEELKAKDEEIKRLRSCLAKDPNTVMIAYESGDHQRLVRAVIKHSERARALEEELKLCCSALDHCLNFAHAIKRRPEQFQAVKDRILRARLLTGMLKNAPRTVRSRQDDLFRARLSLDRSEDGN